MSEKKRVMIIAHFCDVGNENSNNRFNYIANMLACCGFEVELVTSSFSHRAKMQRDNVTDYNNKYRTTCLYEPSYKKNISLKRLFISHRIFAKNLEKYLAVCTRPDWIYCAIPSINVSEVSARYANKENIPFIIDVQDLWPEAYRLIIKNERLYKIATFPMKMRVNRVYKSADEVVAVSDTYAKRALSVNSKCQNGHIIFLGTDLSTFDNNVHNNDTFQKEKEKMYLGYCGTLGSSYDLKCVIEAISMLPSKNQICFIVMGDGPKFDEFKTYAEQKQINSIFTGRLSYDKMCAYLSNCDVVVNPINHGAAQSVINKHADYAAAGLPVINTQECEEYRRLVDTYRMGINCKNDDPSDVANAINYLLDNPNERKIMGSNARLCAVERFDRARTYKEITNLFVTESH